jgi:hypothetical protein
MPYRRCKIIGGTPTRRVLTTRNRASRPTTVEGRNANRHVASPHPDCPKIPSIRHDWHQKQRRHEQQRRRERRQHAASTVAARRFNTPAAVACVIVAGVFTE